MAGLLAADVEAMLAHVLGDVAVADRRARHRKADRFHVALEAEVAHHRRDDAARRKLAGLMPALGDDRHQLVAVDDIALLVDDDDAVGVAVERDADIGAEFLDLIDERFRRRSNRS